MGGYFCPPNISRKASRQEKGRKGQVIGLQLFVQVTEAPVIFRPLHPVTVSCSERLLIQPGLPGYLSFPPQEAGAETVCAAVQVTTGEPKWL